MNHIFTNLCSLNPKLSKNINKTIFQTNLKQNRFFYLIRYHPFQSCSKYKNPKIDLGFGFSTLDLTLKLSETIFNNPRIAQLEQVERVELRLQTTKTQPNLNICGFWNHVSIAYPIYTFHFNLFIFLELGQVEQMDL